MVLMLFILFYFYYFVPKKIHRNLKPHTSFLFFLTYYPIQIIMAEALSPSIPQRGPLYHKVALKV